MILFLSKPQICSLVYIRIITVKISIKHNDYFGFGQEEV
jgi:hypothetical protein